MKNIPVPESPGGKTAYPAGALRINRSAVTAAQHLPVADPQVATADETEFVEDTPVDTTEPS